MTATLFDAYCWTRALREQQFELRRGGLAVDVIVGEDAARAYAGSDPLRGWAAPLAKKEASP